MCEHCPNHICQSTKENSSKKERNKQLILMLAIILFLTAVLGDFSSLEKFILFFIVYIIAGSNVIFKSIRNILKGEIFDENFLMTIATIGAFGIGEYPEAVMVMILFQIGEYFQNKAVEKSRKSISDLMNIKPDYANIEKDGEIIKTSPEKVAIGEIIIVKPGEKIPLDGIIIEGQALVDTTALTGESIPKELKCGDSAISGYINKNGILKIKVEKVFEESTVSKILDLVEHTKGKKAQTENFITKFAKYYTPAVVFGALGLCLIPPIITGSDFTIWFERALTFLVISCPCALVISVPLGFFAGIGGAAKNGVLIKGSNYLETLSKSNTIVFDKTGTLTEGRFVVREIHAQNCISKEELLELAATVEQYSNHPIAISLKDAYSKPIKNKRIAGFKEISGLGIKALIDNEWIYLGNDSLMKELNISFKQETNNIGTVLYLAKSNNFLGYIVISDEIKEDAYNTIKSLNNMGISTIMLTGDTFEAAKYTAEKLEIDKFYYELLPADKIEKLENILSTNKNNGSIVFVGDGINDAPVLMRADAGISMGGLGSDAAIEASDIVIMDDKPSKVVKALNISKKTMKLIKQNIVLAIGVKVLFLLLGSIGLMTMWGAVFADTGIAIIAILNSLRALRA